MSSSSRTAWLEGAPWTWRLALTLGLALELEPEPELWLEQGSGGCCSSWQGALSSCRVLGCSRWNTGGHLHPTWCVVCHVCLTVGCSPRQVSSI